MFDRFLCGLVLRQYARLLTTTVGRGFHIPFISRTTWDQVDLGQIKIVKVRSKL